MLKADATVDNDTFAKCMYLLDGKTDEAGNDDKGMTRSEAAAVLGCSTRTVSAYASAGKIRGLKLGKKGERSVRYSKLSIMALLAAS